MSIKTINRIYDNIKDFEPDDLAGATKTVMPIVEEFSRNAETAEKLILESISEKDFVKFMLMVEKVTASAAISQGATAILLAELSGELRAYTHTVVLTVIGALIEDEIL